uniref:Uncharacterized protein n=1 Tax=Helianthus annuus TaxID=4232 RepID=A0A251VHF6_HELAN
MQRFSYVKRKIRKFNPTSISHSFFLSTLESSRHPKSFHLLIFSPLSLTSSHLYRTSSSQEIEMDLVGVGSFQVLSEIKDVILCRRVLIVYLILD